MHVPCYNDFASLPLSPPPLSFTAPHPEINIAIKHTFLFFQYESTHDRAIRGGTRGGNHGPTTLVPLFLVLPLTFIPP